MIGVMEKVLLDEAAELLEKVNSGRAPQLLPRHRATQLLACYARIERLVGFGKAALAARVGDPAGLARLTGTSMGRARNTVETGRSLESAPLLGDAVRCGRISLDQAEEIAKTEAVSPGAAGRLMEVATTGTFHALRDQARALRIEARSGPGLAARQRQARRLHHRITDLGMIRIEADLEPHIGTPVVNRLETEARRLAREARKAGTSEPFEQHLADALPALLTGTGGGPSRRPELVVLVSHEVAARGWEDVRDGEVCKIPGVGPVAPEMARRIAADAFLTGVFFDGTDLRHIKRWTRSIPPEVRVALQLGQPPGFDGPKCVDCGNRHRIEWDHKQPYAAGGPTSYTNTEGRCDWPCHETKTRTDRQTAKHKPPLPPPPDPEARPP